MLGVGSKNLYLVTTLELMTQRHKLMVDLSANTMAAQESMDLKSKVKHRTPCRQRLYFSLRSKDKDLGRKQVESFTESRKSMASGCGSSRISLMVLNQLLSSSSS